MPSHDCMKWLTPIRHVVSAGSSPFSSSFSKIGSNLRHEEDDQDVEDDEADDGQEDRVGQGADDLGLEVFLVLGEVGDALEHVFEEAAFLAGADHADGQLVEGLRVLGHRLGQAGAVGDLGADLAEHLGQGRLRALPFEDVEAAQQRHAGVQQVGELRVEGRPCAGALTRRPPAEPLRRASWPARCCTGNRPRASSMAIDLALAVGGQRAGAALPGAASAS